MPASPTSYKDADERVATSPISSSIATGDWVSISPISSPGSISSNRMPHSPGVNVENSSPLHVEDRTARDLNSPPLSVSGRIAHLSPANGASFISSDGPAWLAASPPPVRPPRRAELELRRLRVLDAPAPLPVSSPPPPAPPSPPPPNPNGDSHESPVKRGN